MTRPSDNTCADISADVCTNAEVNVTDCDATDRRLSVKLQESSAQCLSVEFVYRTPKGDLVSKTKTFDAVATSCKLGGQCLDPFEQSFSNCYAFRFPKFAMLHWRNDTPLCRWISGDGGITAAERTDRRGGRHKYPPDKDYTTGQNRLYHRKHRYVVLDKRGTCF